jgi:hypothetical protein
MKTALMTLQCYGIDYGRQHTHVVGCYAVHFPGLFGHSSKEVSATDNDADFDAECMDVRDFIGNRRNFCGVKAELIRPSQRLS